MSGGAIALMGETAGAWCIVRWLDGRFCGPISPLDGMSAEFVDQCGGYGFPHGGVGEILRFDSADAARVFADGIGNKTASVDTPMLVSDLHFSAREHVYYTGHSRVLYDGGDFRLALLMAYARRGQLADTPHVAKVTLDCRPIVPTLAAPARAIELDAARSGQ